MSRVIDNQNFVQSLLKVLPSKCVLYEAEDLAPYECDGLSAYRATPIAVVLPDNIEQVKTVLALCHAEQVPVVARGAGTGLSGGALPLDNGILLSLARFNRIIFVA